MYNRNYEYEMKVEGNRVLDKNYRTKYRLEGNRIYDENYRYEGKIEGNKIYDRTTGTKERLMATRSATGITASSTTLKDEMANQKTSDPEFQQRILRRGLCKDLPRIISRPWRLVQE